MPVFKRSQMWLRTAATLAVGVVTVALAAPVAADNAKYFNGAFCRVAFGYEGSNMAASLDYAPNGTVANLSATSSMTLVCPIVRDNTTNIDGWESVEVGYFDKHTADAISCSAQARRFDGTTEWDEGGLSVDTGVGWDKTNMIFDDPTNDSANGGYYYVKCILPPKQGASPPSGIAWYRIEEKG